MRVSRVVSIALAAALLLAAGLIAQPASVKEDPLVRMPGSQPAPEGSVSVEGPGRCLNCHADYNSATEPGHNWQGSMMAQASRDFLFFACMTTAAQDSQWAIGRPNATDICLRCHFPKGWVEGRSEPTNATAMGGDDWNGVQCDTCHIAFDPFFEDTYNGTREGNDWAGYWDETNASSDPSQPAADTTYAEDLTQANLLKLFNGETFFGPDNRPQSSAYDEAGSGQYYLSTGSEKRASFSDAAARHQMLYSRHHKSKYFCATCHDVSNPILANHLLGGVGVNETQADFGPGRTLHTEDNPAYSYFHVERTFSEFMLSAYGAPGGAATNPEFQAQGAPEIGWAAKCQDCHMRDVSGVACNKNGVPVRPEGSTEHPNSGQPLHDLTGGNVWVSTVLASAVPGSPNYDWFNDQQLNQGPEVLTLDLDQGIGIDPVALLAGADRARQQLLLAATIKNLRYDPATGALSFQVQNNSGHKLISGFPEGRRMFLNIKAYSGGSVIWEANPYDYAAGTLKGLGYNYQAGFGLPDPSPLGTAELYLDELVYEAKPSSAELTGETKTFHFALATDRYKDNRLPPKGFRIAEAAARLSTPVWHGTHDESYFTAAEYAGGYDEVSLTIGGGADQVEVGLYYQTTSREYIEFLRDEINGNPANCTLPAAPGTAGCDPANYIVQSDPFFERFRAWGDTIWALWTHNMNDEGAAPFLMAEASWGGGGSGCEAPTPTLQSAVPGHTVVTLGWSDEHGADPAVEGYNVYYDQAGKAQLVSELGQVTSYQDSGLTNGLEYCYMVTSRHADCESGYSNMLCATPDNQAEAEVDAITTGFYSGKGKNQTFNAATTFDAGASVTFRVQVLDIAGAPIEGAVVELQISGPESHAVTTGLSDADGWAEGSWNTQRPNKRGQGGTTPGLYTANVTGLTADGYVWNGTPTSVDFTIQ
jgi:hypothetical protein